MKKENIFEVSRAYIGMTVFVILQVNGIYIFKFLNNFFRQYDLAQVFGITLFISGFFLSSKNYLNKIFEGIKWNIVFGLD